VYLSDKCEFLNANVAKEPTSRFADDFTNAAKQAVSKWRFTCAAPVLTVRQFRQDFVFSPPNIPVVGKEWLAAQGLKLEMEDAVYPWKATSNELEAIVIIRYILGRDCILSGAAVVGTIAGKHDGKTWFFKNEWNGSFEDEVLKVAKKAKISAGICNVQNDIEVQQSFRFIRDDSKRLKYYQNRVLTLRTFLALFQLNKAANQLPIDVTNGCPALISVSSQMPFDKNRVIKVSEPATPLNAQFTQFLEQLELKDQFKMSFFQTPLLVEFPCVNLNP
jgi:hypothetical protein